MDKACKNCLLWENYAERIDLSDNDIEELQGKKVCGKPSSIFTYEIGKYGAVSNGWKTNSFLATEPEFYCARFEPKIGE
jgi:hypothetical protein